MAEVRICSVEGCGKRHVAHGLCSAHVTRLRRYGSVETVLRTPKGAPLNWLKAHVHHHGDDCLIWPFARGGTGGEGVIVFGSKQTTANYVMCILAHGDPPTPKHESAHSCGRGHDACVNPCHLRWATRRENFADKLTHGTHGRGERSSSAKLTVSEVRLIRKLRGAEGQKELAERFGVSKSTIHLIQIRKNWAWLP